MNNIDKLTRELGAALQLAPQYARFVTAKEANEADEGQQEKMKQVELIRMQYQHEAEKGAEADKAKMDDYGEQFRVLHGEIMASEHMQEYQTAAKAMDELLKRVTGIIAGCAQGQDPATYEPEQQGCGGGGCGGGSGGCGGCN